MSTRQTRIAWLVLSFVVVLSLVLASCAPAPKPTVPATPTTPTPTPTPAPTPAPTPTPTSTPGKEMVKDSLGRLVEKPRYGGVAITVLPNPPSGFDDFFLPQSTMYSLHLTNEELLGGDWAKGPTGTGESSWSQVTYVLKLEVGRIAESWEMPVPGTITFHIRKGIRWALDPRSVASRLVNGRELVAEDVAFSIRYTFANPIGYGARTNPGWLESANATDKWTVVVKVKETAIDPAKGFQALIDYTKIYPPEAVRQYGDMRDWRNSVGTGPFMLVDYVSGSSLTYEKNPNYWGRDPLHPANQLPYLDGVKTLIIADKSTQLAALRTGKIDVMNGVLLEDGESLIKANPALQRTKQLAVYVWVLYGRMDKPELPFKDIRVRRALMMAIDFKSIKDDYYGGNAVYPAWPVSPIPEFKDAYTPVEKMPESTQQLFSYNPEKAKQLLTEAGYPNGFKTEVLLQPEYTDMLSIVKANWAKIGVDLKLDEREYSVWLSIQQARAHKEMAMRYRTIGIAGKLNDLVPFMPDNLSFVDDPYITERRAGIYAWEYMANAAKQGQLLKEAALYALDKAWAIPMPTPYTYTIWWPWVQNYHGEIAIGYGDIYNYPIWISLDREMRKEMTGRR